jgi:N-acetylglucosamine-6-phosphate deacetylase
MSAAQVITGIHYQTGQSIEIAVQNGLIKSITPSDSSNHAQLPYLAPGLVDLQVNGYNGVDFNDTSLTVENVTAITLQLLSQGVTTYLPTVITNSNHHIKMLLSIIAEACNQSDLVSNCIGGIHLEGPFISLQEGPLGAHDKQHVCAPDWDLFEQWNAVSGNMIKIVTLSPEWPEAVAFTKQCVERGILVSIGHTAADTEKIAAVVDAGAVMSTHLGNGTHQVLPRHPNYIWDQLADDRLSAGFIGDGFHLPVSLIKVILRMKGQKAILVSDSVSLAGMPPGSYHTPVGGEVVLTNDGKLHLANKPNTLAGSAQMLVQAVTHLYKNNISTLPDAINLASVNAASLLGLPHQTGLTEGAPADLILYYKRENALQIAATYKQGVLGHQSNHC